MNHDMNKEFPAYLDPLSGLPLRWLKARTAIHASPIPCLTSVADKAGKANRYPVLEGIPRLLPTGGNYADAFGEQWLRWRTTQLDSNSGTTITKDRLHRCLGERAVDLLTRTDESTQVLEVGCGAGRFTEILLQFPSARVTSIDLSSAVEANQTNFPQGENHQIVQADHCCPVIEGYV